MSKTPPSTVHPGGVGVRCVPSKAIKLPVASAVSSNFAAPTQGLGQRLFFRAYRATPPARDSRQKWAAVGSLGRASRGQKALPEGSVPITWRLPEQCGHGLL